MQGPCQIAAADFSGESATDRGENATRISVAKTPRSVAKTQQRFQWRICNDLWYFPHENMVSAKTQQSLFRRHDVAKTQRSWRKRNGPDYGKIGGPPSIGTDQLCRRFELPKLCT